MKNNYPYIRVLPSYRQLADIFSRSFFCLTFHVTRSKNSVATHQLLSICALSIAFSGSMFGAELSKQATKKRRRSEYIEPLAKEEQKREALPRKRVADYTPEFPVFKNLADGPADKQAAAMYLAIRKLETDNVEGLLDTAQASSIAFLGAPFFESQGSLDTMKLAAITWDEEDFSSVHRRHIDTLVALKKRGRDGELFHNIPQEESRIVPYLRQPKIWMSYMLTRLEQAETSDEISSLMYVMREYISYRCLSSEDLAAIKNRCLGSQANLERVLSFWGALGHIAWPHQNSAFEAFMGHLFFPVQFEYLFETPACLDQRVHLQELLALSASWGNVLSQCHSADILACYDPQGSGAMQDSVLTYYGKALQKMITGYTKKLSSQKRMPHYYVGLLCIERNKGQSAQAHFQRGHEQGDAWCTYRYALSLKQPQKRQALITILQQRQPGLACLLQTKFVQDPHERIRLFCEAGRAGIAEGYMSAGILARVIKPEDAYEYFLLAGQRYLLSGFKEAASLLREEGHVEEMKEAYRMQGQWGASDGWANLAAQLWQENDKDEAVSSGEKGGLVGYDKLIELERSPKKRKELVEKRALLQKTMFAQLKGSISHAN